MEALRYPVGTIIVVHQTGDVAMERWLVEQTTLVDGLRRVCLVDLGTGMHPYPLLTQAQVDLLMAQHRTHGTEVWAVLPEAAALPTMGTPRGRTPGSVLAGHERQVGGSGAGAARNRVSTLGPVMNGFGR